MKKVYFTICALALLSIQLFGSDSENRISGNELRYAKRLNVGFGYNYYSGIPFVINYELSNKLLHIAEDPLEAYQMGLTFAPQAGFFRYTHWYPSPLPATYPDYNYTVNNLFFGVKVHAYFDRVLDLPKNVDLYFAIAPQFMIRRVSWDFSSSIPGIPPPNNRWLSNRRGRNSFVLPIHIGAEYKLNRNIGVWGDIGTMMSTVGISFRL
jgi:hypothetical protein